MANENIVGIVLMSGIAITGLLLWFSEDYRINRLRMQMAKENLRFSSHEVNELFCLVAVKGIRKSNMEWTYEVIKPYVELFKAKPPESRDMGIHFVEGILRNWRSHAWFARPREDRSTEFVRYLLSSFPEIDAGIRAACESELAYIESRVKA